MPLTITREMMEKDPFFQEGKLEAQREAILNLYRKLNLSPEKIAEVLSIPEDFVKEVIKTDEEWLTWGINLKFNNLLLILFS